MQHEKCVLNLTRGLLMECYGTGECTRHTLSSNYVSVKDNRFPLRSQSCIMFIIYRWPWLQWSCLKKPHWRHALIKSVHESQHPLTVKEMDFVLKKKERKFLLILRLITSQKSFLKCMNQIKQRLHNIWVALNLFRVLFVSQWRRIPVIFWRCRTSPPQRIHAKESRRSSMCSN